MVGVGPLGPRIVFGITGGTFKGPSFSGMFPPPTICHVRLLHFRFGTRLTPVALKATIGSIGGDWGLGDPAAHAFYADARFMLRTTDGANIYVQGSGPQQDTDVIHTRVKLETGHPKYSWLNKVVAVGFEYPGPGSKYIIIDLWKVESPVRGKEDVK